MAFSDDNDAVSSDPQPKAIKSTSFSCTFPSCNNNNLTKDLKWHKVPSEPIYPKTNRYAQVENYCMRNKTRCMTSSRLSNKAKKMKSPRWCSKHKNENPATHGSSFKHRSKNCNVTFTIDPAPTKKGPTLDKNSK